MSITFFAVLLFVLVAKSVAEGGASGDTDYGTDYGLSPTILRVFSIFGTGARMRGAWTQILNNVTGKVGSNVNDITRFRRLDLGR